MYISPPSSPNLRASMFASSYVSPLSLGGESLIDILQNLCESAKNAPSATEFPIGGASLILYAITKESGGLTISDQKNGPIPFEHEENDGATIIGWSKSDEGFYILQDAHGWAATSFRWLPSEPQEAKGISKEIVKL